MRPPEFQSDLRLWVPMYLLAGGMAGIH